MLIEIQNKVITSVRVVFPPFAAFSHGGGGYQFQSNSKGRTIRKLMGAGEVQQKYSRKGKFNENISCTPINPKNIHAMA